MSYCTSCGQKIDNNNQKFCVHCGSLNYVESVDSRKQAINNKSEQTESMKTLKKIGIGFCVVVACIAVIGSTTEVIVGNPKWPSITLAITTLIAVIYGLYKRALKQTMARYCIVVTTLIFVYSVIFLGSAFDKAHTMVNAPVLDKANECINSACYEYYNKSASTLIDALGAPSDHKNNSLIYNIGAHREVYEVDFEKQVVVSAMYVIGNLSDDDANSAQLLIDKALKAKGWINTSRTAKTWEYKKGNGMFNIVCVTNNGGTKNVMLIRV